MYRKRLLSIFLVIALVLILAACSSTNSDNNGSASGNNTSNNTGNSQANNQVEESVEIDFWAWNPSDEVWNEAIKAFNEEHPNIKVNFTRNPSSEYEKKIRVAVQGGEVPDVMAFQFGPMISNYQEILEPLEPYFVEAMGADWASTFDVFPIEAAAELDYKVIPTGLAVTPFIAYDVDMFEQVGAVPPKTYEELKAAIKKFEEANLDGLIPRLGFAGGRGPTVTDLFYTIVNQLAPGKLYEAEAGNIGFNDPDIIRAAEAFKQFFTDDIFQDGNLTVAWNPELRDMFEQRRQLPMIIVGGWIMGDVANKAALEMEDRTFGLLPFPSIDGGKQSVLVNPDLPIGISKDSKHKDAAFKFVKFMTTGEYQHILSKNPTFLPVISGLDADDSQFEAQIEKDAMNLISTLASDPNTIGGIRFLEHATIESALFENLQKVATNQATPEEAMQAVEEVSQKIAR